MVEDTPSPLIPVDVDICGATFKTGKIEWICINPPHDKMYKSRRDGVKFSSNPKTEQHYWVNRFPYRNK